MATATPALDRLSPAQAQPAGTYPEVPSSCQQISKSQHQRNLLYSNILQKPFSILIWTSRKLTVWSSDSVRFGGIQEEGSYERQVMLCWSSGYWGHPDPESSMISELSPPLTIPLTLQYSRRALQVDWFSADHEEQCLQSHCRAQVPSSHHVSTATIGYEERRFLGKLTLGGCSFVELWKGLRGEGHGTLCADYMDFPQFTYINAAFAPAPDDTVGNLYKSFGTEGHLIVNYRWEYIPSSHFPLCTDDRNSNTQAWGWRLAMEMQIDHYQML